MVLTLQPIRGCPQHSGETGTRLSSAIHRRLLSRFFLREGDVCTQAIVDSALIVFQRIFSKWLETSPSSHSFSCLPSEKQVRKQFGSMPVLEESKTIVYVTNHNVITMAMAIFQTYKMADKEEERVLTEILVYSCFIEPFICLVLTMNWEVP